MSAITRRTGGLSLAGLGVAVGRGEAVGAGVRMGAAMRCTLNSWGASCVDVSDGDEDGGRDGDRYSDVWRSVRVALVDAWAGAEESAAVNGPCGARIVWDVGRVPQVLSNSATKIGAMQGERMGVLRVLWCWCGRCSRQMPSDERMQEYTIAWCSMVVQAAVDMRLRMKNIPAMIARFPRHQPDHLAGERHFLSAGSPPASACWLPTGANA